MTRCHILRFLTLKRSCGAECRDYEFREIDEFNEFTEFSEGSGDECLQFSEVYILHKCHSFILIFGFVRSYKLLTFSTIIDCNRKMTKLLYFCVGLCNHSNILSGRNYPPPRLLVGIQRFALVIFSFYLAVYL